MTEDFSEPIHDMEAERFTLAAMMLHPSAIEAAVEILSPENFYRPAHQVIFKAMVMMCAAGQQVDPVTLRAWLVQDGDTKVLGGEGALYLSGLFALPAVAGSASHYARLVLRCATRREVRTTGLQMMSAADQEDLDEADLVAKSHWQLDRILTAGGSSSLDMPVVSTDDFCDAADVHTEPLIPGLLYAQERVVVVGPEGAGKSILGLQMAFTAAAGIHAFSFRPVEPLRVLVIDLENPAHLVQRRFRTFRGLAQSYAGWESRNLMLLHRPGGLNLTSPRDRYGVAQLIKRTGAQLVVAGPIYKMMWGVKTDLDTHAQVASFWDQMREQYGITLWLEAHAPYGDDPRGRVMRPEGSNLWAKWCEFGVSLNWAKKNHDGLKGGLEWTWFKGQREEDRPWPNWITRSQPKGTTWPWVANYDHRPQWTVPPLPEGDGG